MDHGSIEASGVVFDADGSCTLVDGKATDTVDFADFGESEDGWLGGRDSVAVKDVKLSHGTMIPVQVEGDSVELGDGG